MITVKDLKEKLSNYKDTDIVSACSCGEELNVYNAKYDKLGSISIV